MSGHIKRFLGEDVAATAIEYGLIAALVSVGAMGAMMGKVLRVKFFWFP